MLQGLVWIADFESLLFEGSTKKHDQRADPTAKAVLARIADACNDHGVGVRDLAREWIARDVSNISVERLRKILRFWQHFGLLVVTENAEGGRGCHPTYEIVVSELIQFVPPERLPAGLQYVGKKVGGSAQDGEKVGGSAQKGGRLRPEKVGGSAHHTNTKDSYKNTYPADGRPSDPQGAGQPPPEGARGEGRACASDASASGEGGCLGKGERGEARTITPREHLLTGQRQVLIDWIAGERPFGPVLKAAGLSPDLDGDRLDAAIATLDPVAINSVCGFIRWAHRVHHRDRAVKPPIAAVTSIVKAMAANEGGLVEWRCAHLLDEDFRIDAPPADFGKPFERQSEGDQDTEDQQTEDAA